MGKKIIELLTDDLDGTDITDGSGELVEFSYRGTKYEIDLSHSNASQLDEALAAYLAAARRVGRVKPATAVDLGAVRKWAKARGLKVSERGRVSKEILDAYSSAR